MLPYPASYWLAAASAVTKKPAKAFLIPGPKTDDSATAPNGRAS
jgi:hypothetical protein